LAKNCTGPAVEQPSTYANDEPDSWGAFLR
jgi:hypothetical protein